MSRLRLRFIVGLAAAVLWMACADERQGAQDVGPDSAADVSLDAPVSRPSDPTLDYQTTLEWVPCPIETGGVGAEAQCLEVGVPLDWRAPDQRQIEIFVKRIGSGNGGLQVWMLNGGPGGPGSAFEGLAQQVVAALPEIDAYLLDHRGVGRSTRLGCVAESELSIDGYRISDEEWPACIEDLVSRWGDDLAHFTTTNAARDLGWLIRQTRGAGQQAHVFGVSYGTFWLHRYLQLFGEQPDAASMLGVVHPLFSFTEYDRRMDAVGREYLMACSADAFCAERLGSDAVGTTERVVAALEAGHCPEAAAAGYSRSTLRVLFASLIFSAWRERVLVPAFIYRLDRCDAGDVAALQRAAAMLEDPFGGLFNDRLYSRVLGRHISLSEMWEPPIPTAEEFEETVAGALFSTRSNVSRLSEGADWPVYPEDEWADRFAETDVPLLMVNGDLDPASTIEPARQVGEQFDGPGQHFVTLPGGPHSFESPTDEGWSCGLNLWINFVVDPAAPLLDCLGDIQPLDFRGDAELAQTVFGTNSVWDNVAASSIVPTRANPRLAERIRRTYWLVREFGLGF